MKSKTLLFAILVSLSILPTARAESGLTIYAAEIGIGKFHRIDNSIHPYSSDHAWKPYILAKDASTKTPQTIKNNDGSFTVFYSNLDQLLSTTSKLAQSQKMKIKNLNIHAHGLPGHMWFPRDAKAQLSFACANWRRSATAPDEENYNQYYTPVSKSEVMQIRNLSDQSSTGIGISCVTGLKDWQELTPKYSFKTLLTNDAQIHFLSCVVGLGSMGDAFTKGIAQLLVSGDNARVQTSMNFGLGDWSMSEGMGFWDYQNDSQLKRDNSNYPANKTDRQEMQKGTIRTAGLLNGNMMTSLMTNRDFMFSDGRDPGTLTSSVSLERAEAFMGPLPESIRIPGTTVKANLTRK